MTKYTITSDTLLDNINQNEKLLVDEHLLIEHKDLFYAKMFIIGCKYIAFAIVKAAEILRKES